MTNTHCSHAFTYSLMDTHMDNIDKLLSSIVDAAKPEHIEAFHDRATLQHGLAAFDFHFGPKALRWLYTHHTYCVMELLQELGTIAISHRGQDQSHLALPVDLPCTLAATTIMWIIREDANERDGKMSKARYTNRITKLLPHFQLTYDRERSVRSYLNQHHQVSTRYNVYHSGLRVLTVKHREPGTTATRPTPEKVTPIKR